ncbi:MAG: hypothetical protein H6737_21985 [Alphaproteobacteria bacterium]|nr:hypothetical protein [Alphaproteobacteria bacterium]
MIALLLLVSPVEAKKVRFGWQPLRDQSAIRFESNNDATLEGTVSIGERELGTMGTSLVQLEGKSWVLQQVEDGDPRVVDIAWGDRRIRTQLTDGAGVEDDVHPVAGRTWTLDVSNGDLQIRPTAEGAILEAIQISGTQLAGLMEIGVTLDGAVLSTGSPVESAAIAELVGGLVGARPRESSASLEGVRKVDGRKLAVVAVQIALDEQTRSGPGMAMDLSGEVLIDPRTGRLSAIDIAGPVHMKGTEEQDGVLYTTTITGTLKSSTHLLWTDAAP